MDNPGTEKCPIECSFRYCQECLRKIKATTGRCGQCRTIFPERAAQDWLQEKYDIEQDDDGLVGNWVSGSVLAPMKHLGDAGLATFVRKLEDAGWAGRVTMLSIEQNDISNLAPLAHLPALEYLIASDNPIDFAAFKTLLRQAGTLESLETIIHNCDK